MIRFTRVVLVLVGLSFGASAYAVTGEFQVSAGGIAIIGAGYCGDCSPAQGSIANAVLSDGRVVKEFVESLHGFVTGGPDTYKLFFKIAGFSADPGVNYISSVTVNSGCDNPPNVFLPASVFAYGYDAATGTASWVFPPRLACMHPAGFYDISIR